MQYINKKPPAGAKINWAHPLSKNLSGCWLFNGMGQREVDLTRDGLGNAALKNFSSPPLRSTMGLVFDKTDDEVNTSVGLYVGSHTKFTIETWINISSTQNLFTGIFSNNDSSYGLDFRFGTTTLSLRIGNGATINNPTCTYIIPINTWVQLVYVFDADILKHGIYYNAVLKDALSTLTITNVTFLSTLKTCIGHDFSIANRYFGGTIGCIRTWTDRALSTNEIRQLYINPYNMFI